MNESDGRIPVWGVADIVDSRGLTDVSGRRVYGYLPMSNYLVVRPVKKSAAGFMDGTEHRTLLPAAYQQYSFCDIDPMYTEETEGAMMLFRPLFYTSWLLDDFMAFADGPAYRGAQAILLSSASSKTSIGLAFMLARMSKKYSGRIIGLTSPSNVDFVKSLGLYTDVLTYDQVSSLDPVDSIFVDMAGNTKVL